MLADPGWDAIVCGVVPVTIAIINARVAGTKPVKVAVSVTVVLTCRQKAQQGSQEPGGSRVSLWEHAHALASRAADVSKEGTTQAADATLKGQHPSARRV